MYTFSGLVSQALDTHLHVLDRVLRIAIVITVFTCVPGCSDPDRGTDAASAGNAAPEGINTADAARDKATDYRDFPHLLACTERNRSQGRTEPAIVMSRKSTEDGNLELTIARKETIEQFELASQGNNEYQVLDYHVTSSSPFANATTDNMRAESGQFRYYLERLEEEPFVYAMADSQTLKHAAGEYHCEWGGEELQDRLINILRAYERVTRISIRNRREFQQLEQQPWFTAMVILRKGGGCESYRLQIEGVFDPDFPVMANRVAESLMGPAEDSGCIDTNNIDFEKVESAARMAVDYESVDITQYFQNIR